MAPSFSPDTLKEAISADTPSGKTKRALIEAALLHFGKDGYAATSTRTIAQTADTNIASIAYHFDGKAGLREACINFVAMNLMEVAYVILNKDGEDLSQLTREDARQKLMLLIERMVRFVQLNKRSSLLINFVFREITGSENEIEQLYALIFEPLLDRVTLIFSRATGTDVHSDEIRLSVFTMVGQVLYFRMARNLITKRMGWQEIESPQAHQIATVIKRNVNAFLDDLSKGQKDA
ncbi:CerR family C-terminal domain-containing protein [Pseudovibrio sp. Tun.PSC04-5.I4]|uniref:CerR family C-terminal domain-containing protein n=1 Tax=Pseudovibrio sp. Tun.PSC04-5.I4 TaxID=1798213 RepID=UPI00088DF8B9|nr:CerR family C-terminal domain-containing protein [Pseudovibrio sp. Tun.PSC04-5.I4]SDR13799.1 DNA-binding transcriptional regulator, AcrR family [Pseudovibrio sp. Tun.PSC04-5.I4]